MQHIFSRMLSVASLHLAEIIVRLENGLGIGEVELRDEHKEGERVGKAAQEKDFPSLLFREIFVKEKQIIAEIEIGLLGISLI